MIPFRVFHRENKEMWIVLNYQTGATVADGRYLIAKEDDSETDGIMKLVSAEDLVKYRLVDFLDEA